MDQFAFVKVSLEEAKAALDSKIPDIAKPGPVQDWSKNRCKPDPSQDEVAAATFQWLAELPANIRPQALVRLYPRIANRLAEIWKRPLQCECYLDELMMDTRGNRRGFPREVAAEIAALKVHFLSISTAIHYDVWGYADRHSLASRFQRRRALFKRYARPSAISG